MLFKTNTNGHKHPSISLFIIEQDTIDETKEKNKWHSTHEPRNSPKTVQHYSMFFFLYAPMRQVFVPTYHCEDLWIIMKYRNTWVWVYGSKYRGVMWRLDSFTVLFVHPQLKKVFAGC